MRFVDIEYFAKKGIRQAALLIQRPTVNGPEICGSVSGRGAFICTDANCGVFCAQRRLARYRRSKKMIY